MRKTTSTLNDDSELHRQLAEIIVPLQNGAGLHPTLQELKAFVHQRDEARDKTTQIKVYTALRAAADALKASGMQLNIYATVWNKLELLAPELNDEWEKGKSNG